MDAARAGGPIATLDDIAPPASAPAAGRVRPFPTCIQGNSAAPRPGPGVLLFTGRVPSLTCIINSTSAHLHLCVHADADAGLLVALQRHGTLTCLASTHHSLHAKVREAGGGAGREVRAWALACACSLHAARGCLVGPSTCCLLPLAAAPHRHGPPHHPAQHLLLTACLAACCPRLAGAGAARLHLLRQRRRAAGPLLHRGGPRQQPQRPM